MGGLVGGLVAACFEPDMNSKSQPPRVAHNAAPCGASTDAIAHGRLDAHEESSNVSRNP